MIKATLLIDKKTFIACIDNQFSYSLVRKTCVTNNLPIQWELLINDLRETNASYALSLNVPEDNIWQKKRMI